MANAELLKPMHLPAAAWRVLREEGILTFARRSLFFARQRINPILYAPGSDRRCPVCDGTCRRFMPSKYKGEPDARCPHCRAASRHRALSLYLRNEHPQPLGNVLYFAPMPELESQLEPMADLTTFDLVRDTVDVNGGIEQLPFSDSSFDLLICSHVLEHVSDDESAMRELNRVLRPGSEAIILVPQDSTMETTHEGLTDPDERVELYGSPHHVRLYGADLGDKLLAAGFDEYHVNPVGRDYPESKVERFGLRSKWTESGLIELHRCKKH